MNILADASLPGLIEAFPKPFHLTCYHQVKEIAQLLHGQDVLLCRSTLKVDQHLLQNHHLRYVATASSGTDHLDHTWLASQQIQLIDAKGSNAHSVADYLISCLAYLNQHHLPQGKKAGIIGLGKVGEQVSARLQAAGFLVVVYDPLKALHEPFQSCTLEDLWQVDLLCVHAALHDDPPYPSLNLIDKHFLSQLKPGCVIINAARGGIINEEDLLNTANKIIYCTDVYLNEPAIDRRIIDKALLCTPHIAGHSLEAKYAAVAMVSAALHQIMGLANPKFAVPEKKIGHPSLITYVPWLVHGIQNAVSKLDPADKPQGVGREGDLLQKKKKRHLKTNKSWPELILSLYNPLDETLQLKKAEELSAAFLSIRKNHQNRHDFFVEFD